MDDTIQNVETMIRELKIPDTITSDQYPHLDLSECDGNVFMLIGAVGGAWKRVDRGVASRLMTVVNSHAKSYDEAVIFLSQIIQDPE